MPSKSWKLHESAVADFFLTKRMGHKLRSNNETPSDVVVDVGEWLTAIGRSREAPEPWKTLIVECKYRARNQDEASWIRQFWKFYDSVPPNVDTNMQTPMVLFKEGWGLVRLGHWYRVYRGIFASQARGERWLAQLMSLFYIRHTNLAAPAYFREWLEGVGEIDIPLYGPTLPLVCMGSSIARKGDGGGKVMLFNVTGGVGRDDIHA